MPQADGMWEMTFQRETKTWPPKVSMQLGRSVNVHMLGEMVANSFGKTDSKQDSGGTWNLKQKQMDYSKGEASEVLTWKQVIRTVLQKDNTG